MATFDKNINGQVKTLFGGKRNGRYRVQVFSKGNKWRLHVSNNNGSYRYKDFPSQYEAERAADETCVKISRGNYSF